MTLAREARSGYRQGMFAWRDSTNRFDPVLTPAGVALAASAALFHVAGPKGRVVLDLQNVPPVAKGDVVVLGFLAAAGAFLASRTRSEVARRLVGLGLFVLAAAWTMIDHRAAGPVVMSFGDSGHGLHRNDWLALVPAGIGLLLQLPWRRATRTLS